MNAVKFILKEHAKIRGQFKLIAKNKVDKNKIKMFKALCRFLVVHETMEQKIFYPFLKEHGDFKARIRHLVSEEKKAAKAITKFKKIKVNSEWGITLEDKFVKFKDDVDHHAEEEEHELFPAVVKEIEAKELNKIGKKLQAFKNRHYR